MIKKRLTYTPDITVSVSEPNLQNCLLFDIETTGLSYAHSHIYLIGCAFPENGRWQLCQWLAEHSSEEFAVLEAFLQLASGYSRLVTFNGAGFDLPYLKKKCAAYLLSDEALKKPMTDLYRILSPYRSWFGLPHLRQKDAERFMGLYREDAYSGKELITVYRQYRQSDAAVKETLQDTLLLHNAEDVKGMHACIGMLPYLQPFDHHCLYTGGDTDGVRCRFHFQLTDPVPKPFAPEGACSTIVYNETTLHVCLPVLDGCLPVYHADYRQYVHLPEEQMLVSKAFARATGQTHTIPATLSDCYELLSFSPSLLAPPASPKDAENCDAALLCHAYLHWQLACLQKKS